MRALELAFLEVKRLGRGHLLRAVAIAAALLPLLLGGLYLWSFWNPYDRLHNLPVALVNADQPVQDRHDASSVLAAGDDLQRRLLDRDVLDWHVVDASTAREGLESGRYYMTLTIPRDFSARLASPSPGQPSTGRPRSATLVVRRNDATSYLAGRMSQGVFDEVRTAFSAAMSQRYLDRIYMSFADIHDRTARAADNTHRLADALDRAGGDAHGLTTGLRRAGDDSAQLAAGADRLVPQAAQVAQGSGQLATDAGALQADAGQLTDAARALDQEIDAAGDRAGALPERTERLARGSDLVAQGTDRLAAQATGTADVVHQAAKDAKARRGELQRVLDAYGVPAAERGRILAATDAGVARLERSDADAHNQAETARKLASGARSTAQDNKGLAEQAAVLASGIGQAAADAGGLVTRAERIETGAAALAGDARRLATGAAMLWSDSEDTAAGARGLSQALGGLGTGAQGLESGVHHLRNAARALAGGLSADAKRVPDYGAGDRARHADVESDPVRLDLSTFHPVRTNGDGFAPYFVPLALWIGGIVAYVALRPLSDRALATAAPSSRVALAGWLPAAVLVAVEALVLLAVLRFGLGLGIDHPARLVGFLVLAAASFAAMVQWLQAQLGRAGRIIAVGLLILQLTASGGVYPIETAPAFFQAIHPYLPMTYVVQGIRQLLTGDDMTVVGLDAAVLGGFLVAALVLTTWTARRSRTWTVSRLHPELAR